MKILGKMSSDERVGIELTGQIVYTECGNMKTYSMRDWVCIVSV